MAAAVDWLDDYRAGSIDAILKMYADDAVVHCSCVGTKTITRKEGLRAYWVERLRDYSASDLDNIRPSDDGTVLSYVTRDGVVSAVLTFNASGQIASLTCGPRRTVQNEARHELHARPRALYDLGGKPSLRR